MPLAVEHIRRMRGGAQSHLLRCSDSAFYVVKFQNNPQGLRILVNELLSTKLARRLGLPAAEPAVIEVREELIAQTEDMVIQLAHGRTPLKPGLQFGSRYPGHPSETVVYDFLPDEPLRAVTNLADFCGMLAFDKWTCNTNGRQAIFFRASGETAYRAQMIDQGFCFNAGEWNFPDAPLRGIYARHRVYESVRGLETFEPWLERIESRMDASIVGDCAGEIPPEWYDFDATALDALLAHLVRRRSLVRELITSAWKSSAQPFPNWQ